MATTLSHNGFSRTSLQRRACMPGLECTECTSRARYQYSTRADDDMRGSRVGWSRPFCSVGCYRQYAEWQS